MDIGIFINNAAACYIGKYTEMTYSEVEAVVNLNCFYTVFLPKLILEQQLKRSKKSAIMGVSSMVAFFAFAGTTQYSATKVFIKHLYESINREMILGGLSDKIDFCCYQPGYVATKMSLLHTTEEFETYSPDFAA